MTDASAPQAPAGEAEPAASVGYGFTLFVHGVSDAERDAFPGASEGWRTKFRAGNAFLHPLNEAEFDGGISDFLRAVFLEHGSVLEKVAASGTGRDISIAVYYDADATAAICPKLDADIVRRLADMNFAVEICLFPCGDDDEDEDE